MTKSLPYRTFEHMTNDKRREKKKKLKSYKITQQQRKQL